MAKEATKIKRPTALKRDLQNEKRRLRHKAFKSKVRTACRLLQEALDSKNQENARLSLNQVYSLMDKGIKHGVFKTNKVNRIKSRYANKITKA